MPELSPVPPVGAIPWLGIRAGRRWTAGVTDVGGVPVDGWTVGPITAPADLDDLVAARQQIAAVMAQVTQSVRLAELGWGICRIAIEGVQTPRGTRISPATWVTPRTIALAIAAAYPAAVIVPPVAVEQLPPRPSLPAALVRRRPTTWGPCMSPRGDRTPEREAWGVALAAAEGVRAA